MPDRMTRLVISSGLALCRLSDRRGFHRWLARTAGFLGCLVGVFMITVPAFAVVSWFRNDVRAHRNAQNVERRTLALLAIFGDRLPAHEVLDMESLVVAGEPGVAFENLCVQLYEYDVPLEPEAPTRLAEVGEPMRIDPSYWQKLVSPPPRPDLRP